MTEKRFHPFAVLHLLRKTILVYLLPLVQVLFARNWAALWAALVQDLVLFALLSAACWAVLHASGWQMDAHGNLLVRWRLGIRLDRTLRARLMQNSHPVTTSIQAVPMGSQRAAKAAR